VLRLRGGEPPLTGDGLPDERGEEEHEEATVRLMLRSQPRMLEVGEADGDVQRQTAGDHEDLG
jgi:hypothetical protein